MHTQKNITRGTPVPPWEIKLAWLLRALILGTALMHVIEGKFLYALMCLVVIAVLVIPSIVARSSRGNIPFELELAALWGVVGDMTLGRLAGLYGDTIWFDKALHFGNSLLIGFLAFLIVYTLHITGRLRSSLLVNMILVTLIALGIGAFWEILEYIADLIFAEGAQGSPAMSPLNDTMWDLILDGVGGALGGLLGSFYTLHSKRSAKRVEAFSQLITIRRK